MFIQEATRGYHPRTPALSPVRAWRMACTGIAIALVVGNQSVAAQENRTVTLEEAFERAWQQHPAIRVAQGAVDVATGRLSDARLFRFNPELNAVAGPSRAPDTTFTNLGVGLSQTFELGGKRGARSGAAEARLDAAHLRQTRTNRLVLWEVERAFYTAIVARSRVATAQEAERIAADLLDAAEDRLRLGAGTQLDLNLAVAGAARAIRDRLDAERRYASAALELTIATGDDPQDPLEPVGDLPTVPSIAPLDSLLATAFMARSDYQAVNADTRAAEADIDLARAQAWPDARVGVAFAREEELQKSGLDLGISIPLWNRNQGMRAVAEGELDRRSALLFGAQRELERQVRDAHQGAVRMREAEAAFGQDAVERLAENLDLARRSFDAGKINLVEFSVVRRDLVDTQLAYLDTVIDLVNAVIDLKVAVGQPVPGSVEGGQ